MENSIYPGKADLSALGQNAAGRNAGPQGGNRIGDQVRKGAAVAVGPIPAAPVCNSVVPGPLAELLL